MTSPTESLNPGAADDRRAKRRLQVVEQYRAVAHMAKALADVHEQIAPLIGSGSFDRLLDQCGSRSHRIMNEIGDILNGMNAVSEEDEWVEPVFEKARAMFPLGRAALSRDEESGNG